MTTPYLDEAERCSRVALMNRGELMTVDTPAAMKAAMKGEILEIVCDRVREGFALLKANPRVTEVQAFGDRLNVIVGSVREEKAELLDALAKKGIVVRGARRIEPSLENVFITLLTTRERTS
jgi:ABC-2 type transport system ATP-binding protein